MKERVCLSLGRLARESECYAPRLDMSNGKAVDANVSMVGIFVFSFASCHTVSHVPLYRTSQL